MPGIGAVVALTFRSAVDDPVHFSSSKKVGPWAGLAPSLYQQLNSLDLMHLAGGGIIAHPDGIAAGVNSMRQAWEAAVHGADLAEWARSRPALASALRAFGS